MEMCFAGVSFGKTILYLEKEVLPVQEDGNRAGWGVVVFFPYNYSNGR